MKIALIRSSGFVGTALLKEALDRGQPNIYDLQVKGTQSIINGVQPAGVKRPLFVGGAGSLDIKPGVQSADLPGFPAEYKQGARATREALNMLREETSLK